jgi:hypothetical protein
LDRTFVVLFLAAILILVTVRIRPPSRFRGLPKEVHWSQKCWWQDIDVVIAGDSRVTEAVSPRTLQKFLPGKLIRNFGYGMANLNKRYLGLIEQVLKRKGPGRMVVLGVTPLSITREVGTAKYSFWYWWNMSPQDRLLAYYLGGIRQHLERMGTKHIRNALKGKLPLGTRTLDAEGWIAMAPLPETPRAAESIYRDLLTRFPVTPEGLPTLLKRVRRWQQEGITVVGFRPPTPGWMRDLEGKMTGFQAAKVRRGFEAAGATWWTVPDPDSYHSYDGSHLRADAAVRFSLELGKVLKAAATQTKPAIAPAGARKQKS